MDEDVALYENDIHGVSDGANGDIQHRELKQKHNATSRIDSILVFQETEAISDQTSHIAIRANSVATGSIK